MKKTFIVILFLIISISIANADDYDYFSQYSILNPTKQHSLSQEQIDLLKSKKLNLSIEYLNKEIKKGNIDNVKVLLDLKINPNESYFDDYPVYVAAKYNKFDILKLLIENNAKLDLGFNSELYEAVKNKNSLMADYLIEHGAKIDFEDFVSGDTILYISIKNNMKEITQKLLEKGVKVDLKSAKILKKKN